MTMSNKIPASCGLRRSVTMASALSAGLVLFFMLGFARLLPTISLYETRHDQHAGRAA